MQTYWPKVVCKRDEWDHLLRLLNIRIFRCFPCLFFEQKAEHHVQESSGKENQRGTRGSQTEVSMFGVKKPTKRKANLFSRFGYFIRPRGIKELNWNSVSGSTGEPMRDRVQNSATNSNEWWQSVSEYGETRAEWCVYQGETNRKLGKEPSQQKGRRKTTRSVKEGQGPLKKEDRVSGSRPGPMGNSRKADNRRRWECWKREWWNWITESAY